MLRKFIDYYKTKKDIIDQFVKYKEYMVPGKYTLNQSLNYIYIKNNEYTDTVVKILNNGYLVLKYDNASYKIKILNTVLRLYFSRYLTIKDKYNQNFQGIAYMPGARNDSKVFDFTNNRVITIFKDVADAKLNMYQ